MREHPPTRPTTGEPQLTNVFALSRTALANDRTFLAFFRTANGLFVSAVALIKLIDIPLVEVATAVLVAGGVAMLAIGVHRYRRTWRIMDKYSHDYLGGIHPNEL